MPASIAVSSAFVRAVSFVVVAALPSAVHAQDTTEAHAAFEEGRAAMRERRTDDAVRAFEEAVALDPRSSDYHLWLGHAYTRQLSTASFIRKPIIGRKIGPQYDMAVELDSSSVQAAEARVDFYLDAPGIVGGGVDKARAEAERLQRLSPYRAAFARAKIAEKDKKWDTVQHEFAVLMDAYPDSASPHYYFGRASALSGLDLSKGEAALRRFLALLGTNEPQSQAVAHFRLGTIREKQGDVATARTEYDSAIVLHPKLNDAIAARRRLGK